MRAIVAISIKYFYRYLVLFDEVICAIAIRFPEVSRPMPPDALLYIASYICAVHPINRNTNILTILAISNLGVETIRFIFRQTGDHWRAAISITKPRRFEIIKMRPT